jgi:hypothetical protein
MIEIAILTSLSILLFLGIGLLFPWSLFRNSPSYHSLIGSVWIGLALSIAFLQIWQILSPVNLASFGILLAAGVAGWVVSWKKVWRWLAEFNRTTILLSLVGTALTVIFLSTIVIDSGLSSDFGGYHLPTVIWFSKYRLPLGLANLHYRLAYNQTGLLLAAQLDNNIIHGFAYYITSPIILSALLLQTAGALIQCFQKPFEFRASRLAGTLLFFVTIRYATTAQLAGYSPDLLIYALEVVVALEVMDLFEKPDPYDRLLLLKVIQLMLLIGMGVVVKTSFIFFGLVSMVAIVVSLVRSGKWRGNIKPLILSALFTAILIVPWMTRGFIMTGYPLFPSSIMGLPVAWRMPESDAVTIAPIVTNWARTCADTISFENGKLWTLPWLQCQPPEFWAILEISVVLLISAIGVGIWRRVKKVPGLENSSALALLAISASSLFFWLWVLPAYRFAGAVFWLFLVASLILLMSQLFGFFKDETRVKVIVAISIVFIAWLAPNWNAFDLKKSTFFAPPPAMVNAKSHYPQGKIITHALEGGGIVYSSDDPGGGCWDTPLPCTQLNDVRQDLRFFDLNDLSAGFYIQPKANP